MAGLVPAIHDFLTHRAVRPCIGNMIFNAAYIIQFSLRGTDGKKPLVNVAVPL